jgi:hypothetical protein
LTERDSRFAELVDRLRVRNPYSVATRYPGSETSAEHARQAREAMERARNEIRALLELD